MDSRNCLSLGPPTNSAAAAAAAGETTTYLKTMSCPIHDAAGGRPRPTTLAFSRSKSSDGDHLRLLSLHGKPGGPAAGPLLQREKAVVDSRAFYGKNPFHHSHSVTCAIPPVTNQASSSVEAKAKSVGNLAGPMRPRPNVLELCPNQNASFNAYRRRYSRSSERSLDFEDCCSHDFGGATYSRMRYSRRSSSRDSGKAFDILCRQEMEDAAATAAAAAQHATNRGANIRKGMSLLSLCAGRDNDSDDDDDDEDFRRSTKILRPPTRHFYQKGMSGVPVKCPAKYMGLAY